MLVTPHASVSRQQIYHTLYSTAFQVYVTSLLCVYLDKVEAILSQKESLQESAWDITLATQAVKKVRLFG